MCACVCVCVCSKGKGRGIERVIAQYVIAFQKEISLVRYTVLQTHSLSLSSLILLLLLLLHLLFFLNTLCPTIILSLPYIPFPSLQFLSILLILCPSLPSLALKTLPLFCSLSLHSSLKHSHFLLLNHDTSLFIIFTVCFSMYAQCSTVCCSTADRIG